MPALNGESLEMWRSHRLAEGDILAFKGVRTGCRAYLAVSGGIAVPEIMGSRSTFLSGKFGGLEGRSLQKGDTLYADDLLAPMARIGISFPSDWVPALDKEVTLRVVPGPQDYHFTEQGFHTFRSSFYRVTAKSDRMGMRLEGPKIERRSDLEESIISESLIPGGIQVPGDGKPMIILNELITGGYTKIATIISIDLPKVAQLKPGDRVRFDPISVEGAHDLLREQEGQLKSFKESLRHRGNNPIEDESIIPPAFPIPFSVKRDGHPFIKGKAEDYFRRFPMSPSEPIYEIYAVKYAGPFRRPLAKLLWNTDWEKETLVNYYIWVIRGKERNPHRRLRGCSCPCAKDGIEWLHQSRSGSGKDRNRGIPGQESGDHSCEFRSCQWNRTLP